MKKIELSCPVVPAGTVYVLDEPENFGSIPVRTEAMVLPADRPNDHVMGWTVKESIGIGVVNIRSKPVECLVCGELTMDLVGHAEGLNDDGHETLSVMAT